MIAWRSHSVTTALITACPDSMRRRIDLTFSQEEQQLHREKSMLDERGYGQFGKCIVYHKA